MASPEDLRKIGLEGFTIIDKFYGPQRRSTPAQQGRWAFQGPKYEVRTVSNQEPAAAIQFGVKPKPYRWGRPLGN